MVLVKLGDRGPRVSDFQHKLNLKPTKLPRLRVDGVFGPKTHARVVEFQRSCGLKPDGLVGDNTLEKLLEEYPILDLDLFILEISEMLEPIYRPEFLVKAHTIKMQVLLKNPDIIGLTLVEQFGLLALAAAILIVAMMMIMLAQQSRNPAHRRSSVRWSQQVDETKQGTKTDSADKVETRALDQTKKMGREVQVRAQSERDKCEENLLKNNPQKRKECEELFRKLSQAIQNLIQKLNAAGGVRGRTDEIVAKGIGEAVRDVWLAERALGDCTGCDNMW